jgi:hypothetical protein
MIFLLNKNCGGLQMKKRILSLTLTSLLLLACEEIPGRLKVLSDMTVNSNGDSLRLPVGDYETSLQLSGHQINAQIKTESGSVYVEMNVPKNAELPENGPFELTATQSGQPFDVKGTINTSVQRSEDRTETETCEVEYYETICTPQGCYSVPRYRNGFRSVRYYVETIDRKVSFSAVKTSTSKITLAKFYGSDSRSRRHVIAQDRCF